MEQAGGVLQAAGSMEALEPRLLLSVVDFSMDPVGAHAGWAGGTTYAGVVYSATNDGNGNESVFFKIKGLPPGATHKFNPANASNWSNFVWKDEGRSGTAWFYYVPGVGSYIDFIITLPADVAPGSYNLTIACQTDSSGVFREVPYVLNVMPTPQDFGPVSWSEAPPSIPNLDKWEYQMTYWGHKHGAPDFVATYSPGYEAHAWYYDGERVFYEIENYTGDDGWKVSAEAMEHMFSDGYVLPNNGGIPGWRSFSNGTMMDYLDEGDLNSKESVLDLYNASSWNYYYMDQSASRELAYALNHALNIKAMGLANAATEDRIQRQVGIILGHLDQQFLSKTVTEDSIYSSDNDAHGNYISVFMAALSSEALIRYYEMYKAEGKVDTRIPYMVKLAADWLMSEAYVWQDHMWTYHRYDPYNPDARPQPNPQQINFRDLNLLIAPMYGWLYKNTGNDAYRQIGDDAFQWGVDYAYVYGGKQWSQNYRWSADYVMWRTDIAASSDKVAPIVANVSDSPAVLKHTDYDFSAASGKWDLPVIQTTPAHIIKWTTSEIADSQIEYGIDTSYGMTSQLNTLKVKKHIVSLKGLTPGQLYHYRIKTVDPSGNVGYSLDRTFVFAGTDSAGPTISNVRVANGNVTFETSEPAFTSVQYGLTSGYGSTADDTTTLGNALYHMATQSHVIAFSGANGYSVYHFRINATDYSGNVTSSSDFVYYGAASSDTVNPTLGITSALPTSPISGNFTVAANASDNKVVSAVVFKLGDNAIDCYSGPYSATFDTTRLRDGKYQLAVTAIDGAGRQVSTTPVDVWVLNHRTGDPNGDGAVNGQDIFPFLQALSSMGLYEQAYPALSAGLSADFNGDHLVNGQDIYGFLQALSDETAAPAADSVASQQSPQLEIASPLPAAAEQSSLLDNNASYSVAGYGSSSNSLLPELASVQLSTRDAEADDALTGEKLEGLLSVL